MPGPNIQITQDIVNAMIVDHVETKSYRKTARKFNVSPNTVKKYVLNECATNKKFVRRVEQIKEQKEKDILDYLTVNNKKLLQTLENILSVTSNPANIQKEFDKKGLSALNSTMGTIFDKVMKHEELKLKKDSLEFSKNVIETYKPENDGFKSAMASRLEEFTENPMKLIDEESLNE